jgi:Flp pilus assembly pilin Flp
LAWHALAGCRATQGVAMAFWQNDQGQGLIEYALILAVISITLLIAMLFFRGNLMNLFSNIGNNLT